MPVVVDAHVHFHDKRDAQRGLRWGWLEASSGSQRLGSLASVKTDRFVAPDLLSEAWRSGVEKCVHVEAASVTPNPAVESAWLSEMAEKHGWPNAIVARARMVDDDVETTLEAHAKYSRVVGIRDFARDGELEHIEFSRGLNALSRFGWTCDIVSRWPSFGSLAAIAREFPNQTFILDHLGDPESNSQEYFRAWRDHLPKVGAAENILVKFSGLGMWDHRWSVKSARPWFSELLSAFGPNRILFGSNWPIDRAFSSYGDTVGLITSLTAELTRNERDSILRRNAERIYQIEAPPSEQGTLRSGTQPTK